MNREDLKALGLTDEQIEKVMASHGLVVNSTKQELESVTTERDNLQTQLTDRDTQLTTLKAEVKDNEVLTTKITELETENSNAKTQYEADLKDLTMTNAIKLALNGKVHDEELAAGLINKEKLVLGDDGKVVGLDEQLTGLKESKAFLFKSEESQQQQQQTGFQGKVGGDGKGTPPDGKAPSLMDAISSHFNTQK